MSLVLRSYDKLQLMKLLLLLLITSTLFGEVIHSSLSQYYEYKTFSNSLQKTDGSVIGLGLDLHKNKSEYKLTYEFGHTKTKQPPLKTDLLTQKVFMRYGYEFGKCAVNFNYIFIDDNIAITDGGKTFGVGSTCSISKPFSINYTLFFTNYEDFNVIQNDIKINYNLEFKESKIRFSSITKHISIDTKNQNSFSKNAKDSYLTSGLKLHLKYKNFHLGSGIYFGKRAFAIMNDGFKIQHHAMEFDKTYALGLGIKIKKQLLRVQYIYQRATELPKEQKNVEVSNVRIVLNYIF